MINRKVVVIIDYRNVITQGHADVMQRHLKYAQLLKQYANIELQIHSPGKRGFQKTENGNFSFSGRPPWMVLSYLRSLKAELKRNESSPVLLISGDPWESLILARLFRHLIGKPIPIQVQFHGDIASEKWKYLNFRNFTRYYATFLTLSSRKNLYFRSVSNVQSENLKSKFAIDIKSSDILPVELNLTASTKRTKTKPDEIRIAFMGRLHQDRGTSLFVEILKNLKEWPDGIQIVIVGDGPEKEKFINELAALNMNIKVNYLGFLEGEQYAEVWSEVDVLLSTAPLESYGRAIREALVSGIPVIATKTSGVLDLKYALSQKWLQLISFPLQSTELVQQFKTALSLNISPNYREVLTKESQRRSSDLVLRWLEIIKVSNQEELSN